MKKILIMVMLSTMVFAEEMCYVTICNKIERFSLNPLSHIGDNIGETCYDTYMPKNQAVVGSVLTSESRWYHGGNPTKKSVTKIKTVKYCR